MSIQNVITKFSKKAIHYLLYHYAAAQSALNIHLAHLYWIDA